MHRFPITPGEAISAVHVLRLQTDHRGCSAHPFWAFTAMQPDHLQECTGNTGSNTQSAEIAAHLTCITALCLSLSSSHNKWFAKADSSLKCSPILCFPQSLQRDRPSKGCSEHTSLNPRSYYPPCKRGHSPLITRGKKDLSLGGELAFLTPSCHVWALAVSTLMCPLSAPPPHTHTETQPNLPSMAATALLVTRAALRKALLPWDWLYVSAKLPLQHVNK